MPKQLGQTVLDFPQQQEAAFDKWLRASEMQDFKKAADKLIPKDSWCNKSSGQVKRTGDSE